MRVIIFLSLSILFAGITTGQRVNISASLTFAGPIAGFSTSAAIAEVPTNLRNDISSVLFAIANGIGVDSPFIEYNGISNTTTSFTIFFAIFTTNDNSLALAASLKIPQLKSSDFPSLNATYSKYSSNQSLPPLTAAVNTVTPSLESTSTIQAAVIFNGSNPVLANFLTNTELTKALISDVAGILRLYLSQFTLNSVSSTTTSTTITFSVVCFTKSAFPLSLSIQKLQSSDLPTLKTAYLKYSSGQPLPSYVGVVNSITPPLSSTTTINASMLFNGNYTTFRSPAALPQIQKSLYFDLGDALSVQEPQITLTITSTTNNTIINFTIVTLDSYVLTIVAAIPQLKSSNFESLAYQYQLFASGQSLPPFTITLNSVTPPLPLTTVAATTMPPTTSVPASVISAVLTIAGSFPTTRAAIPIPAAAASSLTSDLTKLLNVTADQVSITALNTTNTSTNISFTVTAPTSSVGSLSSAIRGINSTSLPALGAYYFNATGQPLPAVAPSVTSVATAPAPTSAISGNNVNGGGTSTPLSGGGIAGIVIACVVVVAAIVGAVVYFSMCRSQKVTSTTAA